MKYLKRKSAIKVDKTKGSIVDTENVDDEVTNTFSIRIIKNLLSKVKVPTKTSELTNDSDFITSDAIPTQTSELTNDSGFITELKISSITTSGHTPVSNRYFGTQEAYETDATYTKAGYYPISIFAYCNGVRLESCYIKSGGLGTATIHFRMYNSSSSTAYTGTLNVFITWIK